VAQNQNQSQSGQQGGQGSQDGQHQGGQQGGQGGQQGVVAVGVPNSKIRTQTVVEVYGTTSKRIRGTINGSLFETLNPRGKSPVFLWDAEFPTITATGRLINSATNAGRRST
jgi:hypothetical protein